MADPGVPCAQGWEPVMPSLEIRVLCIQWVWGKGVHGRLHSCDPMTRGKHGRGQGQNGTHLNYQQMWCQRKTRRRPVLSGCIQYEQVRMSQIQEPCPPYAEREEGANFSEKKKTSESQRMGHWRGGSEWISLTSPKGEDESSWLVLRIRVSLTD